MSNFIEKQKLLDWLNQCAESIYTRGSMHGSFAEQEASLTTLLAMKDLVLDKPPRNSLDEVRHKVCRKYKLRPILAFSVQMENLNVSPSDEQIHFSQILKYWWEHE